MESSNDSTIELLVIEQHSYALADHSHAHQRKIGEHANIGATSTWRITWHPATYQGWQAKLGNATTWTAVYRVQLDADDVLAPLDQLAVQGRQAAEVFVIDGKPTTPAWQRVGATGPACTCSLCLSRLQESSREKP